MPPRAYRSPVARKPRVMIYVEPVVLRGDPLFFANWMIAIDRWASASGAEVDFHLVSSPALLERARADYVSRVAVDSDAILEPFGGDRRRYMRDVCGDATGNDALRAALSQAQARIAPDIVVSWTPNAYLPAAFGEASVLYTENGPAPRHGCVLVKYLDPFAHQAGSAFERLVEPLWPDSPHDAALDWLAQWRAVMARDAERRGIADWIATLPQTRRRVLVALQPPDSLTYEGIGPDLSPLQYLAMVAARASPDDVVIPQWHPAQPPPTQQDLDWIARQAPGVAPPPAAFRTGLSEHLAAHVDEIVTISSNVALLALLLGKALRVDGRAKFAALQTRAGETPAPRPDLLSFTLERYCDPSADWDAPGFFAHRIQALARDPEALFGVSRLTPERARRYLRGA